MTQNDNQDCWYGVQDAKTRKQIQDRLAQRARRQRIKAATSSISSSTSSDSAPRSDTRKSSAINSRERNGHSTTTTTTTITSPPATTTNNPPHQQQQLTTLQSSLRQLTTPDRSPLTTAVYSIHPTPDPHGHKIAQQVPLSLYTAMYNNGLILGLTCATVIPQKSPPPGPHVPPSLRPTRLQLETVHLPWIDRLPFPRWRDNMITREAEFNEEEFLCDCFNMERAIWIREGGVGWRAEDWVVGSGFGGKWGWLLMN